MGLTVASGLRCSLLDSSHCWCCLSGAKWHFANGSDVREDAPVLSAHWPFCPPECVYVGKSPACLSTKEQSGGGTHQLPVPTLYFPGRDQPGVGEAGCCGQHVDLLWAGLSQLWDHLTVSGMADTPLTTPSQHADICPAAGKRLFYLTLNLKKLFLLIVCRDLASYNSACMCQFFVQIFASTPWFFFHSGTPGNKFMVYSFP